MASLKRPRAVGARAAYRSRCARQCPLRVRSGHFARSDRCPLCPQKRTSVECSGMSAKCQKQTLVTSFDYFCQALKTKRVPV
jgi:hypothetical protein